MTPEQLAAQLAQAVPQRLKSVMLYGSAAAGDFVPGASTYNLLILIEPVATAELDSIAPTILEWSRAGHPAPLIFTPEGFLSSTDAFPIELLDIQQSRRVLWGPDLLAEMRVQPNHLRLQVERELTGKLLSLRGRYLLTEGKPEAKLELMTRGLSTILVLFRAALRLYQSEVPPKKLDALRALKKHIDFNIEPFERLFDLKKSHAQAPDAPQVSFDAYLRAIEAVVNAVNLLSQLPRNET
jgi:hypothetical protein